MELLEGQPLEDVIPAGGLPIDQGLRYGLQVADAVAHAHDRGVIHCDLKTRNTLVTPQGPSSCAAKRRIRAATCGRLPWMPLPSFFCRPVK
jgi:serine/threonine protein kinase